MRHFTLIVLLAFTAFAQAPDGIVASVSRTVNITPDEADFAVTVSTTLDITQDQVTQVFQDAGIQNLKVTGVSTGSNNPFIAFDPATGGPAPSELQYQIAFTSDPAALTSYTKKLDALNSKRPTGFVSLQYSAALNASQTALQPPPV
jgi:hypothetical protein